LQDFSTISRPAPLASSIGFSSAEAVATMHALTTLTKEVGINAAFSLGEAREYALMTCSHTAATQKRLAGRQEPDGARVIGSIFLTYTRVTGAYTCTGQTTARAIG
jgi:hypothetical protein